MNTERFAAKKLEGVTMSAIRTITERAKAIALQGHEVAMFSMGEPDFDTPAPIKDATCRKLDENRTHYTSNRGAPALRRAIAEKELRDCGLSYDPENEILLTNSGAEAINNALTAFIDPGTEVVVLTPAFVSYRNVAALCGGIVREAPLRAETGFQVDEAALEAAVTDRTRLLVLNNPSNPTGAVLGAESLAAVRRVALKHDLLVFSDEIYNNLLYTGAPYTSIASLPDMRERTIVMNGFSKTYAMTGWRVGYLCYPAWMDSALIRVHQYSTTTGVTFIQEALAETMNAPETLLAVERMRQEFAARRDLAMRLLDAIPGLNYIKPEGAFYIMIDASGTGMDGETFARRALEEAYVAFVPAQAFGGGCGGFVRMSYAASRSVIESGLRRLGKWLS